MVVGSLRAKLREELGDNEHEADWIIAHVTKMSQEEFIKNPRDITEEEYNEIMEITARRSMGEPLQYILGETEFMGLTFKVNDNVLIPRQDTETLVETVIKKIKDKNVRVLDIGTGSGCVGISIAKLCPNAEVTMLDYSEAVLDVAEENAKLNDVNVNLIKCDILEEIPEGKFDVIVSNPPYIETDTIFSLDNIVARYEPPEALDGGFDGLMFYQRIAELAPEIMDDNSFLAVEIGYNQAEAVTEILDEAEFSAIKVIEDPCENERVITAKYKSSLFSDLIP